MEITPAKTGLAAASTWWAAFFRWASAWVAALVLWQGRGTTHNGSRKIVRYFAVGGLALRLLVGSGGMA